MSRGGEYFKGVDILVNEDVQSDGVGMSWGLSQREGWVFTPPWI